MSDKITARLADVDKVMARSQVPNASQFLENPSVIKAPVPRRQQIIQQLPDDAIISREDGTLAIGRFILAGYGLEVPDDVTIAEFETVFTVMFKVSDQIGLWIGDALAAYERLEYGSVDEIAAYFGVANGTVRNWKSRSVSVELSRRRDNLARVQAIMPDVKQLSPSHYSAIASLDPDDQDNMMRHALMKGWSVADLREAVRKFKGEDKQLPSPFDQYRDRLTALSSQRKSLALTPDQRLMLISFHQHEIEKLRDA